MVLECDIGLFSAFKTKNIQRQTFNFQKKMFKNTHYKAANMKGPLLQISVKQPSISFINHLITEPLLLNNSLIEEV